MAPAEPLHQVEAALVERAVETRRHEFAVGRQCARRALARFNVTGVPLLAGPDRAPLWPEGLLGSITHTLAGPAGFCGAAVAARRDVAALGIDAEGVDPLPSACWDLVLTEVEKRRLCGEPEAGRLAKLVFVAKEAVFKALFPTLGRILEFRDVQVDLAPAGDGFEAEVLSQPETLPPRMPACAGRFAVGDHIAIAAVVMPADGNPRLGPYQPGWVPPPSEERLVRP